MSYAAVSVSMALVASVAAGLVAAEQTIRVGVDLVNFGVVVTDRRGSPITGLTQADFEVIERGKAQQIQFFASADVAIAPPLHLGFLLDASGSMDQDLRNVRTAAIKFLNENEHAVDMTLVDFDTEVRVARFAAADFPRFVERLRNRKPDGWTALYDAIGVYLNGAQQQEGQKVLVLYTDGGDTRSSLTFHDMLDLCKASDVTVYAVGYIEHQGSGRLQQRAELERVSSLTGGQAYFPGVAKDLDGVFEKIREELAGRYMLGYLSSDPRTDGAWRPVEIKLLRNDLKGVRLRTRTGYFAPYKP